MATKQIYQSLWLSDIHLGCKDCKAEMLLQLLQQTKAKRIFLVGDIVDVWALKRRVYWPESHNQVLQHLMNLAKSACEVVYIPGNHDQLFKAYDGMDLADVTVSKQYLYTSITGKQILMVHGDQFDEEVCFGRFYAKLGDHLYDFLLFLNRSSSKIRHAMGYPYWSLAGYIKSKIAKATEAIARYRDAVVNEAVKQGVDVVICGHIHHPELSLQKGVVYANDGDWIENCTLLCETMDGQLQLRRWDDRLKTTVELVAVALAEPQAQALSAEKVA
ncbi:MULTISPECIES: UDP-2,3-diacylglucosamine diphosphatase [unclassified Agarivorans]|uniref:UDP-2,3-diacylglucosamine diphosphatase n=1 Tax=unclassified Agarivorans TaxID=2636026 RepID=UPI0026E422CC|nr:MULTISPECIES: UDP-2,3-diacylglucosamine diphosphatase [unclassified Agarivorans]MDO6684659.1 UDP-2,3-diacylglucosamine diphosphatase [Agarivorans sp. 3_MG-2023]MDO6714824.1 UDP-2,3-diacylglucosamine diphosphatase [Agarivorans sp. 2_MG-2023]